MMELLVKELINAVEGKLVNGNTNVKITGISTDSRKITKGELFVPLKGERFDGEDFVKDAVSSGAVAVITADLRNVELLKDTTVAVIYVKDTLTAFHEIAAYYRKKFDIPFIAVTGSSGKTTTKDMIAEVLSKKYAVLKTGGNFNNEIGLPLTIFRLESYHQIAVVEMGMSGIGEIKRLKEIAKPQVAVFTNIGVAHIEKLGSRENILKAKAELIEDFGENNVIVLNADDDMLVRLPQTYRGKYYKYGITNGDVKAYNIEKDERGVRYVLKVRELEKRVELSIPGMHNVYNSLAAICVGLEFGVSVEDMADALREFKPEKMRLNIIDGGKIKIIDDAYNANPDSMKAALTVLRDLDSKRKVAVLGDMLELGEYSKEAHKDIGKFVLECGIDVLVTSGNFAKYIAEEAKICGMNSSNIFICKNNEEANKVLDSIIKEGDLILVKGSRGMKMEQIVHHLQERVK
ncbi:UDP-N-acetylmuramoyl-tripeptide--D-alanyl-D-alanine ligase MurF [Thermoanaerobacter kivui]|uniref:UDP-N-acetylmuramoyl-tripeptide--D-alanyl-D-alanine ligase n=1 Tax=Thermoanaerobacter kivui TaxID=2325 RepID=A0A097ASB4_THEKI|nr:UDP-N-acetylmuramoyl-tripeptide--D-alanyl-D-alanine ligase [Thermoanaerobacter kivui]AIS52711.1 UDP-N-acetylmuramoyl-tripeptide--D-alanyl-D-alanine ligase MurF [Thermoanaerobacter kivui]